MNSVDQEVTVRGVEGEKLMKRTQEESNEVGEESKRIPLHDFHPMINDRIEKLLPSSSFPFELFVIPIVFVTNC